MQARPLQQHTPLCYSNVGTNSNPQLSRTAPAPPQMPPAPPFVGRFTGAQHTHGGHQGHGSCASIQAHPSSSLAAVQAHNNATGVSQLPIDVRGVAPAQSELPHRSSEETKPEHTPAFCNSSQTVNLQTIRLCLELLRRGSWRLLENLVVSWETARVHQLYLKAIF